MCSAYYISLQWTMFWSILNISEVSRVLPPPPGWTGESCLLPGLRISRNFGGTSVPFSLWLLSNEGTRRTCACDLFTLPLSSHFSRASEIVCLLLSLRLRRLCMSSTSASLPRSSMVKGSWSCWLTNRGRFKKWYPCYSWDAWLRSTKCLV